MALLPPGGGSKTDTPTPGNPRLKEHTQHQTPLDTQYHSTSRNIGIILVTLDI